MAARAGKSAWPALVLALSVGLLLSMSTGARASISPGGWDRLGVGGAPNTSALNGRVDALYAAAPDSLYAGGAFTSASGDTTASHVARWDGRAWHSIGAPALNGDVHAIAYDGGKLYVGGNFVDAGGDSNADFLAVWDGASWTPFCSPITANVTALQVIGRTLYVGGSFQDGAGIPSADYLVACNLDTGAAGSTVDSAAHAFQGSLYALAADSNGTLYAGGGFTDLGGDPAADNVAYKDGTGWHAMGSGGAPCGCAVNTFVRSLAVAGTDVYVGTDATDVAGIVRADHVARWNGSAWSAVGANAATTNGWFPASTFINAIATSGSKIYAGGSFQNADGNATADEVAVFDGATWAPMGSDGAGNGPLGGPVNALALFGGQAVVGGNFTSAGGDTLAGYVARFPGIADVPPTAEATMQVPGFVKYPVSAHWSAHDADGTVAGYRWQWGDGTPDDVGTTDAGYVEHMYSTAGTYHVKLLVTDNERVQGTFAQDVVVRFGPHSAYTWTPLRPMVGETVSFHGAATDPDGTILGYNWWFDPMPSGSGAGDYLTNAGPTPTHVFAKAGDVRVNMVSYECDPNTCFGADANFQTLTVIPATIPSVSRAAVTNARFRVGSGSTAIAAKAPLGTSFKFMLKAPAKVLVAIARSAPGVRSGKRCIAPPRKRKARAKSCTRSLRAGTLTRANLQPGANAIAFSGRIGKRALKPGSYGATLTASNGTGKAKPVVVRFTIVK
jgi:hypothetical protein